MEAWATWRDGLFVAVSKQIIEPFVMKGAVKPNRGGEASDFMNIEIKMKIYPRSRDGQDLKA